MEKNQFVNKVEMKQKTIVNSEYVNHVSCIYR